MIVSRSFSAFVLEISHILAEKTTHFRTKSNGNWYSNVPYVQRPES